jgi:hypothetical protein
LLRASERRMRARATPFALSAHVKVGRNELCPCGSGFKYKRCHGTCPACRRMRTRRGWLPNFDHSESITDPPCRICAAERPCRRGLVSLCSGASWSSEGWLVWRNQSCQTSLSRSISCL